jgi:dTDP-4-dehydrorhamnose reductase
LCSRAQLNIESTASIERVLDAIDPWAIVNTAGYVRVDEAEHDQLRCHTENSVGAASLANACAIRNLPLVTFSSDLVFDGTKSEPYVESDAVRPLNVYGKSKADAERSVLREHPGTLVVRTSALFGPWDAHNFLTRTLRILQSGGSATAMDDVIVSPTYVPDLVNATLDLLIDGEHGVWHLANRGAVSWVELAARTAKLAKVGTQRLHTIHSRHARLRARRPQYSALGSERGILLPDLDDALRRYVAEAHDRLTSSVAA